MADNQDTIYFGGAGASNAGADTHDDTIYFGSAAAAEPTKWTGSAGLPSAPTSLTDIGHSIMAGSHGVMATGAGAIASLQNDPVAEADWQQTAQAQERAAEESRAAVTPGAQGWRTWAAEQAPGLAAIAIPTAVATAATGGFGGAAVMSGLMGAQTRSDVYNQLTGEGITPTSGQLAAATGVGVAGGVATEAAGPLVGKIATSKLVDAALGITAPAVVIGAQQAGQEGVTESAEIGAGKRTGYDPRAIGSQFAGGAEFGAALGVGNVFHGKTRLPEGGVSAEPTRSERDYAKPEKRVAAPVDVETPPENKGPPQPAPKVDPAQAAALSVTPRVTQPEVVPEPTVQPEGPTTVQPEPQPTERPVGAPPEGATTGVLRTPQPPPEPQPLPAPAPPREAVAAVPPAPVETPAQQHAALLDPANPREAMVYDKGVQPIEIADKSAFGQIKLPDGRVVQFDKNGPSGLTVAKIRQYVKDGVLDERLTPAATETPAAPERPADIGAPQAEVEQPKEVVQPKVAEVTPLGKPGRILEAQDEVSIRARNEAAFQEAQQARTVQDQLKAKEAAKEAGVKDRSHAAKEDQAKVTNDNINAQRIVDKYPRQDPTPNWRNETYSRAKAMVDEAKQADITIPKTFPEGHPHSGAMLKLREAADLTATKFPKPDAYARFMDREHMIDTGREQEAFDVRRNEGAKGLGSPEGAVEGVRGRGEAEEEPAYTAGKAAVGFQKVTTKSRRLHQDDDFHRELEELESKWAEEERGGLPEGVVWTRDAQDNPTHVVPKETLTSKEAVAKHLDLTKYPRLLRPMVKILSERLMDVAGHVPVHFISGADMERLTGKSTVMGYYDPSLDHIIMNADRHTPDTVLHEVFHAATNWAVNEDSQLRNDIGRLMDEIEPQLGRVNAFLTPDEQKWFRYAMKNPDEFITGIMTNPHVQNAAKYMRISDGLAKDLNIAKWRGASVWAGFISRIMSKFGLPPRYFSAIEAVMSVSERATWLRDPAAQMEFSARTGKVTPESKSGRLLQEDPEASDLENGVAPARVDSRAKQATSYVKARLGDVGTVSSAVTALTRNLFDTPRDWVTRAKEKNWGLAKQADHWLDEMGAQSATRERIIKLSTPLMDRLGAFSHTNAEDFKKLGKLFVSSTIHGADARDDLGSGKNAHINPNPTDKAGKVGLENAPKEHWEALKGSPEDRAAYKSLSPEGRKLYDDTMDELRDMRAREVASGRAALIDGLRTELTRKGNTIAGDRKDAVLKVLDGKKLTDEEQESHGNDNAIEALRDYDAMAAANTRGVYFPLDHGDGSHVVMGEHDYKLPEGAERAKPDNPESPDYHRILFDNKKDAFEFAPRNAAGDLLPVEHQTVEGEHHVIVNPREVQFVNGNVEGEHVRAHMLAPKSEGGLGMDPNKVSQVQPRKNQQPWQQSSSANAVREQIKRLDKMPDLTDSDRERMADAIKHVAATSMPGTRLRSSMLERDRTGGAGQDILRDIDKYRRRSAGQQAASRHRPAINEALQEMHKFIDANGGHADAGAMRQMVNLFDDRTNNFVRDNAGDASTNRNWSAVQAFNALEGLVTPAFHLLHQLHIPLTVVPDLATESNGATAARIAASVYKRMGASQTGIGIKGMSRAIMKGWRYDHKPTDFMDAITSDMKLTPSERETFNWLRDHDIMQHTGMDFSHANAGSSAVARASARMRNFSSEFIGSADAANKVNSMLMYHALGAEKGLTSDALHKYVADGITRTQGQFASWNRAGAFQSPMMRAVLQYKQYPIMLSKMIAKSMYNSFAPTRHPVTGKIGYHAADWETRARALKTFGYMTLTASLMSGVQGGTAYPIRLTDDLLSKLGVTDGWSAHMDKLHRYLGDQLGATGADAIMHGLGGVTGMYLGHRGGISDPLGLSYLLETMPKDNPEDSILKWMAGAPTGTAHNIFSALGAAKNGDIAGLATNLLPRVIGDPIKAIQEASKGVSTQKGTLISPPVSDWQSVLKGIGFTNITETNAREARAAVGREQAQQHDARTAVLSKVRSGDMAGALRAMRQFNLDNPKNKMTQTELLKAKNAKPTMLGYADTPRTRADLQQRSREYGLAP